MTELLLNPESKIKVQAELSLVFMNARAIGIDSDVWEEPMAFKPESFIGSKLDYKGQHYEFLPFGAGRRMCVGVPLAHRVLHLALGSLLHEFNWEFDGRIYPKTMDMRDRMGVATRQYVPLLVVPKRKQHKTWFAWKFMFAM
ncbi:cytochrome P450 76A1-like [Rhodamnia argentea]|uniref:Cytochrome P450 76A1-like n=1 Tax=Rhodamnia argentea TaxID=178133 RepID=A0ABM3H4K3_9MYRT|nr:cytochrome P450 76A1-like [Rhodamnia argentea]